MRRPRVVRGERVTFARVLGNVTRSFRVGCTRFTSLSCAARNRQLVSLAALERNKAEDFSARRLLVGYASAAVVLVLLLVLGVVYGKEIKQRAVDESTPVVFTPPKPVEAPKPVAKVEPKPAPKAKNWNPPPLGRPEALAPKEIPTEAPKQGDPNAPVSELPGVPGGSPDGVVGGTGTGGGAPVVAKPAPAPTVAPAPAPMVQTSEAIVPPHAISQPSPPFPEEARKAGVQMVVTVKFTVLEDGSVADVVVVKGHPLLDAEVVRTVSRWRFAPATLDGRAVRVTRFAKVPFRPRS